MTNYDILKEYEVHKTPVPSYQEYLESESHCAVYSEVNKSLKQENQQLKELLRGCRDVIKDVDSYCTKDADEGYMLIYKIDNAIGEK